MFPFFPGCGVNSELIKPAEMKIKFVVCIFIFILVKLNVFASLHVVPTFHSAGIYWSPKTEITIKKALVFYKQEGTVNWNSGLDLHWLICENGTFEFRGSLVRLNSGTEYKILVKYNEITDSMVFKTWDENFKIKKEIKVNPQGTFKTTEAGNANEGYVVYAPIDKFDPEIDGGGNAEVGIDVLHDWVIIRGFKIKNVKKYGIRLHPEQKYAVIEKCEISKWGHNTGQRFAKAKESNAIHLSGSENLKASHIVIQDNYIFQPSFDTNNWDEPSDIKKGGNHPNGNQAIWLENTGGNLVIRYNTIKGSIRNYYNDGMGEWRNFGPHGFPYRDSDIHNNYISHVWDNAIESEGGNMNVRIYENFTDSCYAHYGLSNITLGPLYVFNNVSFVGHKFPGDCNEAVFLKIGNKLKFDKTTNKSWPAAGIAFVFNNTLLQPVVNGKKNGISKFATSTGPSEGVVYMNNIINTTGNNGNDFEILPLQTNSIAKNNLYYGGVLNEIGLANNICAMPVYNIQRGGWYLEKDSQGYKQGIFIPNFSEGYSGSLPDIGAYQNGKPPLVFGVRK